ncbi:MAG: FGGY-family carbohydrate kinase, partial [Saprospiraceae bacterium]
VDGSITAGMIGMEAGQSAYGDYYAWWQNVIIGPVRELLGEDSATRMMEKLIPFLSDKAAHLPLTIHDPVATDWINGRRTPDANHTLKASFSGMNLSTDAVAIFKMIVEATAFGSKAIVDRFRNEGIDIHQVVAIGGVAKKSSFVMQTLCDVLDMPIKVAMSDQACALGAAINASVAGGVYPNIQEAQEAMASSFDTEYIPNQNHVQVYQYLYQKYLSLGKFTENNND